jgi:energy-coupling factor transport system substrate-specific component
MPYKRLITAIVIMILLIVSVTNAWMEDHYILLAFIIIAFAMLPLFIRFERKRLDAREMVLIALLSAVAAVSRIPFASLPNVQPTSAIVILSAYVFGSEMGFVVGVVATIVSNMFLGQGPWTPWQMFCWGMMGLTAGIVRERGWIKTRRGLSVFGFLWGFIFGWIMNLWFLIGFVSPLTLATMLKAYLTSLYFDLAHGISNFFFIYVFYNGWLKKLERIKFKYGFVRKSDDEKT